MKLSRKLKLILYPAMAILMMAPAVSTSVNASTSRPNNNPHNDAEYASIMNQSNRHLNAKQSGDDIFDINNLRALYERMYSQNHHHKDSSAVKARAKHQSKNDLINDVASLYRKDSRDHNWNPNSNSSANFLAMRKQFRHQNITKNFRSLGGYNTKDGKYHVRHDRIYRSDDLRHLTPDAHRELQHLGINQVIDLQSETPTRERKDQRNLGRHGPKTNVDQVFSSVQERNASQNLIGQSKYDQMRNKYSHLLLEPKQASRAYRNVFKALLRNKHGAIDYHCHSGKDRTGIASMMILTALNVPKNTIVKDYMLSYVYGASGTKLTPYQQKGLIESAYSYLNRHYGGVKGYLRNRVGLSRQQIKKLQKKYLVRN